MRFFIIFTFIFSLQLSAQQVFLGIGHAFKNAVVNPIKNIKRNKNTKKYQEILSQHDENDTEFRCEESPAVFRLTYHQNIPSKENTLPFKNHDDVYKINNPLGYCWGHANITSKFNRLAIFKPETKIDFEENSKEWKQFYKKIVKNISNKNLAQIIPGFSNLREFSEHPYILKLMANAVQNSWAKTATTIKGLKAGLKKENSVEEKKEIFAKIMKRLNSAHAPLLTMHYLGENFTETHIIIIWKYLGEVSPGLHQFCANDNNATFDLNENCHNKMTINFEANGPILYHQRKFLDIEGVTFKVGVDFSYLDDSDAFEQMNSLKQICEKNSI